MALYDTVANVVSEAAVELGLGAVSDVYGSADANVVQLRGLLKRTGRTLAKQYLWKQLLKEGTLTTPTANQDLTVFNLPADYGSYVDGTLFNRTAQMPTAVVTPQQWQGLKASGLTATVVATFRTYDQTLQFLTTPPTGEVYGYEYRSRYWVKSFGAPAADKDAPTANTDTLLFESDLLIPALKVAWLQAKGFESSAAQNEFDVAFALDTSANEGAAPTLSLSRPHGVRLIDGGNVPDTGYGS
jgi:hypothetical protein